MKELIVPVAVVGVLASMLLPVPPMVLDFLLVANLIGALVLLMSTLYISDTLKLSSLPTMLLLATLVRLALNISTTRNILGHGEAGKVVEAFGNVVIQGNLVVGVVIFLIITLVQFIVIAKGSERVAEVSARFTLDALPGKQMSIDADVRAGLIDFSAARTKRQDLQTESRFYGALDGAMKFIKGDAIAGIVITAINIIGGLSVGIAIQGLELGEAINRYTILTVGDGLVAQIPALLNSLAAGIVVTKVGRGDDASLASELLAQLGQLQQAKILIGCFALLVAIVPGMPGLPFFALAGILLGSAVAGRSQKAESNTPPTCVFQPKPLPVLRIELDEETGRELILAGELVGRLDRFRQDVYERFGLILKIPDFAISPGIERAYRIVVRGTAGPTISFTGDTSAKITQVCSALLESVERRTIDFIDDAGTRQILDLFEAQNPELVTSVVPGIITVTQMTEVLKALCREEVPFVNFDSILQAVAEHGSKASSERILLEEVRVALRWTISALHADSDRAVHGITVDPLIDLSLAKSEREGGLVDLALIDTIIEHGSHAERPLIVTSRGARRILRDYLVLKGVRWPVIAHDEIAEDFRLATVGHVVLSGAVAADNTLQRIAA